MRGTEKILLRAANETKTPRSVREPRLKSLRAFREWAGPLLLRMNLGFFNLPSQARNFVLQTSGSACHAEQINEKDRDNNQVSNSKKSILVSTIESTWIVLVLASSVPITLTLCPKNFSGVFWSLSA